jgi:predicted GNAT family N-acyltransferase
LFDGLTFKLADPVERAQAFDLQREVYGGDVGHVPHDEYDQRADYLIAHDVNGEVVAAFRVVGPEQRPFDLEKFVDLSAVIAQDRSVALVGRLCIRHSHRDVSRKAFLPAGIMKLAFTFARKRGITDFVMYTFPHLVNFYRSAFFRTLNLTFEHPGYRCTMHVMHLDLIDLEQRLSQSREPIARLLFGPNSMKVLI